MTTFLTIFRRFPTTFRRFSKIVPKEDERFRTFSDIFRRLPKISVEAPIMFRSYSDISKFFFSDYVTIAMVITLVTMATPISSHVKNKNVHCVRWRYDFLVKREILVFHRCLCNNNLLTVTDSKYRELLDRFEKSKTLKLCLKNAFREFSWKILFRFSKNLASSRNSQKMKIHIFTSFNMHKISGKLAKLLVFALKQFTILEHGINLAQKLHLSSI